VKVVRLKMTSERRVCLGLAGVKSSIFLGAETMAVQRRGRKARAPNERLCRSRRTESK